MGAKFADRLRGPGDQVGELCGDSAIARDEDLVERIDVSLGRSVAMRFPPFCGDPAETQDSADVGRFAIPIRDARLLDRDLDAELCEPSTGIRRERAMIDDRAPVEEDELSDV
jgi:hypothetical protein